MPPNLNVNRLSTPARPERSRRVSRIPFAFIILGFIAAAFLLYGRTLAGDFIHGDDEHMIVQNVYLSDWRYFPGLWTENIKAGFGQVTNHWRPLQMSLYFLAVKAFGMTPWPFHAMNIFFHGLAGAGLCLLLWRLLDGVPAFLPALAALLWMAHPIQVEDVAMPNGTATPLHASLVIWGLWAFTKSLKQSSPSPPPSPVEGEGVRKNVEGGIKVWYWLSLGLFVLALLSKESAIVFPLLALGLNLTMIKQEFLGLTLTPSPFPEEGRVRGATLRSLVIYHSPFWIVAALYIVLRLTILNFGGTLNFYTQENIFTQNFSYRLFTLLTVLAHALRLFVFPVGLHPERSWSVFTEFFSGPVLTGFATVAGLTAAGWWFRKRAPYVSFGIFWFFASYAPTSNLAAKINALFWEHWLYLPFAGIVIAVTAALSRRSAPSPESSIPSSIFIVLIALVFGVMTIHRARHWRDSESYFRYVLRYEPRQAKLWTNLAMAVALKGNSEEEAIGYYERAIRLDDSYPETRHNLANAYLNTGRVDLAKAEFKRALIINPRFYHSHLALAKISIAQGDVKGAMRSLEAALAIYPHIEEARLMLEQLKKAGSK